MAQQVDAVVVSPSLLQQVKELMHSMTAQELVEVKGHLGQLFVKQCPLLDLPAELAITSTSCALCKTNRSLPSPEYRTRSRSIQEATPTVCNHVNLLCSWHVVRSVRRPFRTTTAKTCSTSKTTPLHANRWACAMRQHLGHLRCIRFEKWIYVLYRTRALKIQFRVELDNDDKVKVDYSQMESRCSCEFKEAVANVKQCGKSTVNKGLLLLLVMLSFKKIPARRRDRGYGKCGKVEMSYDDEVR